MNIKIRTISQLLDTLQGGLAGRTRVIEADGKVTGTAFESFAFPQQTKVNIIHNVAVLKPFMESYSAARTALIEKLSPDGTPKAIDDNPVLAAMFMREHEELMQAKMPVKGLALLNWTDLDAAKVHPHVISALGFLVRGLPAVNPDDLLSDGTEV